MNIRSIFLYIFFLFISGPLLAAPLPLSEVPPRVGRLHLCPEYWGYMQQAGADYGVDPCLVAAVAAIESRFNPGAISGRGACIGLMQLHRDTARQLGVNPWDPEQNIRGGAQLLARLLHRYRGNLTRALQKYNTAWTPAYDREVRRAWRQAKCTLIQDK